MRKTALQILKELKRKPLRIKELANLLGKSESWISNVVTELEEESLVEKNLKVKIAGTYEASLLTKLLDSYNSEKILAGKKENILKTLLKDPKTAGELESVGFPKSTVYDALKDLKTTGVIEKVEERYKIADETLADFLKAQEHKGSRGVYRRNGERIVVVEDTKGNEGKLTAFSAFSRYEVDYYPRKIYLYQGKEELNPEDVLIHAVLCAENKKQMAMCGVFYLKNKSRIQTGKLWKLSEKWNCTERLADLLAFLDQRKVKQEDLFLPWDEFTALVKGYGINLRGEHPRDDLIASFNKVGEILGEDLEAYLIGGANMILRDLKDTTKDIDIILRDKRSLNTFYRALEKQGYKEMVEIGQNYEELEPKVILEKKGFPRWDIFVKKVAGCIQLTEKMRKRSKKFKNLGKLNLRLISPTDIFLFKSVTDREGDLEDTALIAKKKEINWQELFEEIKKQEEFTGRHLSFAVLNTLDHLVERYRIDVPIRNRLTSYCLEKALILSLEKPKTIRDLRKELDFPEHQIFNKLKKLEEENLIEVDRSGKLNKYEVKK